MSISPKSGLSPMRQSRGEVYQKSVVGKTCEKDRFRAESEKEKRVNLYSPFIVAK